MSFMDKTVSSVVVKVAPLVGILLTRLLTDGSGLGARGVVDLVIDLVNLFLVVKVKDGNTPLS